MYKRQNSASSIMLSAKLYKIRSRTFWKDFCLLIIVKASTAALTVERSFHAISPVLDPVLQNWGTRVQR